MKLPQNETLRLGTVDIFNHISVCESEFILPAFSFAQKLGLKLDSNVLRNIVTSIGIHINDLGLLDLCQLNARLSDYPQYENSHLEKIIYLRAVEVFKQMELKSSMEQEQISDLSDIDNPVIIGMIIQLLRFPNHTRLLSTAESVFYNQAQRDVQYSIRSDRENLAECIFLAEIFMHDAKVHKRNLFLPKYFKNFRKSETICLISSIFGIRYFEAGIQDLTDVEKDKIDEIVASFQNLISECSEEIVERYNRAFDQYFQALDVADFDLRNVGSIYTLLAGEDLGMIYAKRDAALSHGPLLKQHSPDPITPLSVL